MTSNKASRRTKSRTVFAIASLKGGVGKSTLAIYLSQLMRELKKKVLVVDLDPNNNLTDWFLGDLDPEDLSDANAYHFLTGRKEAQDCIYPDDYGYFILPCTPMIHMAGVELHANPAAMVMRGSGLRDLNYDVIIIDTPPSMSFEMRVGLYAADRILIPISTNRWAMMGRELLETEIRQVEAMGNNPKVYCVPSMVSSTELEIIRKTNTLPFTKSGITRSAGLKTSVEKRRHLRSGNRSWEEFRTLAKEVLR